MFDHKPLKCVFSRYTCHGKILVCSHKFIVLCMFILPRGGDKYINK